MNLYGIIRQSRKSILFALSLVVIEYTAWIIEPSLFGNVIDVFIDKELAHSSMEFIFPTILWCGIFLLNSGTGAFRRSVEPKVYMPLFSRMAMSVAKDGFKKKHSVSKIAGRADLVREYIHFFQYHIPEIIDQTISIGGAMIALAFFDYRIAVACLTIAGPLMIITKRYAKKIEDEQHSLHNIREETFDVFSNGDLAKIEEYYKNMSASEKKIAHWGGMNFGIVRIFLLLIFLTVLFIAIDIDDFTTGNIYAIVAYLWTFVTSTEYLPELLESLTSLKELNQRLKVSSKNGEPE
jgi:ABC-type multidrug transport system fused ATPase/permease subunit